MKSTSSGEQVIVCQSEVVDENGVKTSSQVVTRVPVGTPVPPGCHLG